MDTNFDHNKILKKIAKSRLEPFGIIQKGKSRSFLYDNGWWTIIIEFQPSAYSKGSFLNIGLDYNFYPRDYFAFTYGYREKEFEEAKDEAQFNQLVNDYCDLIIKRVDELKLKFKDIPKAINTCEKRFKNDTQDSFTLGVLYGLKNDFSNSKDYLEKVIHSKSEYEYEIERKKIATQILDWIVNSDLFLTNIKDLINKTRQLKKLEAVDLSNINDVDINAKHSLFYNGVSWFKKRLKN